MRRHFWTEVSFFVARTKSWYKAVMTKVMDGDMTDQERIRDLYDLLVGYAEDHDMSIYENREYPIRVSQYGKQMCAYCDARMMGEFYEQMYWLFMLYEARHYQIDSGMLYLERHRDKKARFYEPRREMFTRFGITQAMQDLMDDKLDLLTVSLPPGVGKSTIEIFFLALVGGYFPDDFNLSSAHSSILTRSLYDGINEIITDPYEYAWHEIFQGVKTNGTNAKETTINLGRGGRFKTWTFRSIDGSLTGATRCNRFETLDDMVSGIEEALNKQRLESLWTKIVNDLFSRMLDGCKRMIFATRWSVHDPIGKMYDRYCTDPRARFISVPALDENGESNFDYPVNGFSKEYFLAQRDLMDPISFDALYMQKPIEREGLLFSPTELRRFFMDESQVPESRTSYNVLPTTEPDAIWCVCDTKDKGADFASMPVAYQYGEDFYIPDVVFDDDTNYDVLDTKMANMIIKHDPHKARFESNVAGGRIAANIEKMVKGKCRTMIDTKYTTANKETKILVNSDWVKKHCLFLEPSLYGTQSDYGKFMGNLCGYTTKAKVPHDDAPDSMAMLAEYIAEGFRRRRTAIRKSPI